MKARAGKKKVVLELGGNAGAIVDATADLDWALKRSLMGAFSYAGQVCVSVQRLFVHESIWDTFMDRFVAGADALSVGDPMDPETQLGPMVDAGVGAAHAALGGRGHRGRRAGACGWPGRRPGIPRDGAGGCAA